MIRMIAISSPQFLKFRLLGFLVLLLFFCFLYHLSLPIPLTLSHTFYGTFSLHVFLYQRIVRNYWNFCWLLFLGGFDKLVWLLKLIVLFLPSRIICNVLRDGNPPLQPILLFVFLILMKSNKFETVGEIFGGQNFNELLI